MPDKAPKTSTRKITVTIPKDVLAMMDEFVPPEERNSFIVEVIKEQLDLLDQVRVLDETAGAWKEEDHPDLRTPEDIDRYIAELRGTWKIPSQP